LHRGYVIEHADGIIMKLELSAGHSGSDLRSNQFPPAPEEELLAFRHPVLKDKQD
jgi:hypothetical protein